MCALNAHTISYSQSLPFLEQNVQPFGEDDLVYCEIRPLSPSSSARKEKRSGHLYFYISTTGIVGAEQANWLIVVSGD